MAKRGRVAAREERDTDERPRRIRKYKWFVLIVCEDQKTEPHYFRSFLDDFTKESVFIRTVGTGRSTVGVVKQAINERERLLADWRKEADEIWVVFDRDDAHLVDANKMRFREAFSLAGKENIEVAYSNEAFELWLLLHFTGVSKNIPISRADLIQQLGKRINALPGLEHFQYQHGSVDVIDILQKRGS